MPQHPPIAQVVIVGTVRVIPDRRDEFVRLMTALLHPTRAEAGCLGFSFGVDGLDENSFLVQEEYLDSAALTVHQSADYVASYAAALPGVLDGDVTFRIYDTSSRTTFTVEAATREATSA